MKQDATELQNRLRYCTEKKHEATNRITVNRLPNALAKNGFCLKSNQPQFTKGKGTTELFTQSPRRQQIHISQINFKLMTHYACAKKSKNKKIIEDKCIHTLNYFT